MRESFTPGARRALGRAEAHARNRGAVLVEPDDLLAALADEAESRAAELLTRHGLEPRRLQELLGVEPLPSDNELIEAGTLAHSAILRGVLGEVEMRARSLDRSRAVGTEQILTGLLAAGGPTIERLVSAGLALPQMLAEDQSRERTESGPIPFDTEVPALDLTGPGEFVDLARILDASANRAREGLRVVEDYVRFGLDDPMLVRRLKDVRHRLAGAIRGLGLEERIAARETRGDVGTYIMTPSEQVRENPRAVLVANFKRAGEALRSLEEYTKLADSWLAGRFEVLRYDLYTLEKLVLTAVAAHELIGEARLYVLVGGMPTLGDLRWVVEEALAGGAQVIQLREKGLPDREVLKRAREIRAATARAHARFLMNDRPDLALLAGADGVHLGQEDLSMRDARRVLGTRGIIGISTHDPEQVEAAVLDGAGYLGVGPVFSSTTKEFVDLAGLAFVRRAAAAVTLPWFALGGIDESNLEAVLEAGATRIAVSAAVVRASSPRAAAASLRARLDTIEN